ncbi:tyrosine-protein phosphatase [Aeromicrobium fastidiosum]|uniref:Tyrosine-protein phosphatase n=1 Tax=Aeromicrobium fastidiosum TaxID=52699 RepID=A0A641ALF6_9ACTN|nr:tyrosine-protein phosphatase [Aeromicrobium fastidiosum]KAA1378120.1 tyrosine-protein phosphatase [Aeromicrobium fastidiosum]MBP2389082.1 hypothetical protein [Aeromicrobium fastidiosum]
MPDLTPNLRDIGGLPAAGGRATATGRVLRSAVPRAGDLAPDGIAWPPSLVIDLRSSTELAEAHPLSAAGARIVNVPLLAALRPGVAPVDTLTLLYRLVLDTAADELVRLVDEIAHEPGPTLVHCAAGKDRTGISIALLLRLVGVSGDDVLHDYNLTEHARHEIDARLRPSSAGPPPAHTYPPGFAHVSPEAIESVLEVWDGHGDGVEGWFVEAGGSSTSVDQLRRTLLA